MNDLKEKYESPSNGKNSRNLQIDAMKGYAILLVVLGHSVQGNVSDFDSNTIFRVIYSFHMPLFMFLSGYLAFSKIKKMDVTYILKKFKVLIIPCVVWYLIDYVIGYCISGKFDISFYEYIIRFLKAPDWGLWFLWVLFLNFCVVDIAINLDKYLKDFSLILAIFVVKYLPINILGFGLLKWHLPFFIGGYLIAKHINKLSRFGKPIGVMSIVIYPLLASIWKRNVVPEYIQSLNTILHSYKIKGVILSYLYLVPFMGISFSYVLIRLLEKTPIYTGLVFLGKYTLEIYILHGNFLRVSIGSGYIAILSGAIIATALSLIVSNILKKNTLAKKILFGVYLI